jgi:hypothetical protein
MSYFRELIDAMKENPRRLVMVPFIPLWVMSNLAILAGDWCERQMERLSDWANK